MNPKFSDLVFDLACDSSLAERIFNKMALTIDDSDTIKSYAIYGFLYKTFENILIILSGFYDIFEMDYEETVEEVIQQFDKYYIDKCFKYYPALSDEGVFKAWFINGIIPVTIENIYKYTTAVEAFVDVHGSEKGDIKDLYNLFISTKNSRKEYMTIGNL